MERRIRKRKGSRPLLKTRIIPALLTALAVSILTFVLYHVGSSLSHITGSSAILFASFGASAFILFMMPRAKTARMGSFVKAYVMGTILGVIGFYMLSFIPFYLVVGIIIFVLTLAMYVANAEHPPAIGILLAFVLFKIDIYGVIIVVLGIVILLFLRVILERFVYIVEKDVVDEIERR